VFGLVGLESRVNPNGFAPIRPTFPGAIVGASRGWGQCGLLVLADAHLYAYRSSVGTCVLDHERENECQMSDDILDTDILDPWSGIKFHAPTMWSLDTCMRNLARVKHITRSNC